MAVTGCSPDICDEGRRHGGQVDGGEGRGILYQSTVADLKQQQTSGLSKQPGLINLTMDKGESTALPVMCKIIAIQLELLRKLCRLLAAILSGPRRVPTCQCRCKQDVLSLLTDLQGSIHQT